MLVLAGLAVAAIFDLDGARTISAALIGAGVVIGAFGIFAGPGPPAMDVPGFEGDYVRHVHHADATARRAWQNDTLVLLLAGVALVALGVAIGLLG